MTGMGVRAPFGAVTAAVAIYDDTTNSKKSTGASLAYALSKATALNVGIKAPKGSDSETYVGLSHSF